MSDLADRYRLLRDELGDNHPETVAAFYARAREVYAEELAVSGGAVSLWYLSFVDTAVAAQIPLDQQVPGGPSFLGACIVEGIGMIDATTNARRLGCNPGGEVQGYGPFPPGAWDLSWLNRLLGKDEALALPEPRVGPSHDG